jgi:hypothetical protein
MGNDRNRYPKGYALAWVIDSSRRVYRPAQSRKIRRLSDMGSKSMKRLAANIAELLALWLVIGIVLATAALVLAPIDIAQPQPIFRSTT